MQRFRSAFAVASLSSALLSSALLSSALFAACGSNDADGPAGPAPFTPPVTQPASAEPPAAPPPAPAADDPAAEDVAPGVTDPVVPPATDSNGTSGELDTGAVGPIDNGEGTENEGNSGAGTGEDDGAGAAEPPPVDPSTLPPLRIWIAGDSTVANGLTPCPRGWGGVIGSRFDERVTIVNSAVGGRSVNTWLYNVLTTMDARGECELTRGANGEPTLQPRWQQMLDGMQAGDYLLIQFGINDSSGTCDRHVGIEAFKASYGMMAEAAKARGAHPVFLTPVSSIACNGTTARGSRGGFVPATQEAGAEFDVPVIDLHARSVELFQSLAFCPVAGGDVSAATTGPVGDFFCDDHTHFSNTGTESIADLVVQGLRDLNVPLAAYLK